MASVFDDPNVKVAVAAPQPQRVKPAYRVVKLEGTVPRRIYVRDAKTGKISTKTITEPAGFMVHMMNGSSLRARNVEHLMRLGITALVPLVDTVTGDTVGAVEL